MTTHYIAVLSGFNDSTHPFDAKVIPLESLTVENLYQVLCEIPFYGYEHSRLTNRDTWFRINEHVTMQDVISGCVNEVVVPVVSDSLSQATNYTLTILTPDKYMTMVEHELFVLRKQMYYKAGLFVQ